VYLGVQAIRHRRLLATALDATVANNSTGRLVRDGTIVGASNPKAIAFFAAALPQLVTRPPARSWYRCWC
jgi:threonine/homoserine/homoserine lactone efflux protein